MFQEAFVLHYSVPKSYLSSRLQGRSRHANQPDQTARYEDNTPRHGRKQARHTALQRHPAQEFEGGGHVRVRGAEQRLSELQRTLVQRLRFGILALTLLPVRRRS